MQYAGGQIGGNLRWKRLAGVGGRASESPRRTFEARVFPSIVSIIVISQADIPRIHHDTGLNLHELHFTSVLYPLLFANIYCINKMGQGVSSAGSHQAMSKGELRNAHEVSADH